MTPTAHEIMTVHLVTGAPLFEVKEFLTNASPTLCDRVIAAARHAKIESKKSIFGKLEDPLLYDPEMGKIIEKIGEEEASNIWNENEGEWPRGSCRLMWKRMKERLANEHHIEWFSPADLNPFNTYI